MESGVSPLLRPYLSLLILVPESFGLEPERMQEMVKEINQTGVAPEEVLSDSVYYFDGEEIRIVAK